MPQLQRAPSSPHVSPFAVHTTANTYTNTTPFPNYLLNEVMPALKDTEWRLLCVVVRQTLGWKDVSSGGRKSSDWLTRAQLMKKTGRNSEALSHALDSLVQQNLIEARNKSGQPLRTPSQRRQVRGRIYYALHPLLIQRISHNQPALEKHKKSELENKEDLKTCSVLESADRKSEHHNAAKSNRTKENTKEIETKRDVVQSQQIQDSFDDERKEMDSFIIEERLWDLKNSESLPRSMQNFTDVYVEKYAQRFPRSAPPAVFTSALSRLETILHQQSESELATLLDVFFACGLAHIERQQYSLEAFVHNINVLQESGL